MIEPSFDAPVPGESLTAELGGRPWQKPPQYSTVEDALEYYVPRLTDKDFESDLLDTMELGVPVTTMANSIQITGVMQGLHTVDVGLLLIPVLMEMIAFLGDRANIEYKMGTDKKPKDKISDSKLQLALQKMKEAEGNEEELPVEEMPEPVEEPVPSGLMARRT
jgi:hypothetical protein|tara:strand:- start:215 stop:706 length:492 start_codon:yes stop_codon:yes gene_type:complete